MASRDSPPFFVNVPSMSVAIAQYPNVETVRGSSAGLFIASAARVLADAP